MQNINIQKNSFLQKDILSEENLPDDIKLLSEKMKITSKTTQNLYMMKSNFVIKTRIQKNLKAMDCYQKLSKFWLKEMKNISKIK